MRPFAGAVSLGFVPMDDYARRHKAFVIRDYLNQEGIERMNQPAKSPDINPIENAWKMLQRCIGAGNSPPGTVAELERALIEEWSKLTLGELRKLIRSFHSRCRAVIAARDTDSDIRFKFLENSQGF